jgi:hypothetical protein
MLKISKRTNLDIKDAACLHIVHNLEYPNNKVQANYNRQCSEKEHFAPSSGQIRQIDKVVNPMTSPSE